MTPLGKRYRNDDFIRGHAREALCFQVVVLVLWIPVVVGAAIEQSFVVALSFLALGFLVECVQALRAMKARTPLRLTSFVMR